MNKKKIFIILFVLFTFFLISLFTYKVFFSGKMLSGKENIEYVQKIKNKDDFLSYKSISPFKEIILFVSIKTNNKNLWDIYWNSGAYKKIQNPNFSEKDFLENTSNAFLDIVNKKDLTKYKDYLLDGYIFLSNLSISEKIDKCSEHHITQNCSKCKKYDELHDTEPTERFQNCVNMSYLYDAIMNFNIESCYKISNAPSIKYLTENCEEALKIYK